MKKRIISLLLLVAMLLTILPLTALAEDELVSVEAPDVPNTEIEENVESGDMETSAGDADREKKTADETRIPEVELSEEAEFCYSYAGTAGPNATCASRFSAINLNDWVQICACGCNCVGMGAQACVAPCCRIIHYINK